MPIFAQLGLVGAVGVAVVAWLARPQRPWPKGECYKGFFSTENRRGE